MSVPQTRFASAGAAATAFIQAAPLASKQLARTATTPLRAASRRRATHSRRSAPAYMRWSGNRGNGPSVPPQDRVLSILPYVIPLLDSLSFGKYVFQKVPLLTQVLLVPLLPLYNIYRGVPFLAFGVFLLLFVTVVRNINVSRFIRFNTYQALILDIALIFPQLFQGVRLGSAIPASVAEICTTAVFYAVMLAVSYAAVMNAQGKLPDEIPALSDSVKQQLGPF